MFAEVEDFKVSCYGSSLALSGRFKQGTTYTIKLPSLLVDKFGQKIDKADTDKGIHD